MAKKLDLETDLLDINSNNLPDNMVAAVVLLNANHEIEHAGIVIRYNGENKLLHFNPDDVLIEDLSDYDLYYYKELSFVDSILTPTFLAHCQIIASRAKPEYFYFYANSMYDSESNFISPQDFPEYMTCVGFCLNVLKFYLSDDDFFELDDWNEDTVNRGEGYIEHFLEKIRIKYPDLDIEEFRQGIRRIFPIEYISGAFLDTPVRKSSTDILAPQIEQIIQRRNTA